MKQAFNIKMSKSELLQLQINTNDYLTEADETEEAEFSETVSKLLKNDGL
jgi:hypothetical protein